MKKQNVKLTEKQLKQIVHLVMKSRAEMPENETVVVAGYGWQYTFIIFLSKSGEDAISLN